MKKFLNGYLCPAGLYFSAAVLLFTLALVAVDGLSGTSALKPSTVGCLALLSLLLTAAGKILKIEKFSLITRTLLHYLAVVASCAVIVLLSRPDLGTGAGVLLAGTVLTVLYALVATIVLLAVCRKKKTVNETQKYKRQF